MPRTLTHDKPLTFPPPLSQNAHGSRGGGGESVPSVCWARAVGGSPLEEELSEARVLKTESAFIS